MDTMQPQREGGGVDVRLVAASSRDLRGLIRTNAFREDLFRRLNGIAIGIPPLRARSDDVAALVQAFARRHSRRLGRRVTGIDPDSLAALTQYAWPGNIRELASLVERALVASDAQVLRISTDFFAPTAHDERAAIGATASIPVRAPLAKPADFDDTLSTGLHVVQREHILRILNATHWVIEGNSGAALKLGMKPATLRHRMKKLGISRAQTPQTG
jgi:transcriptional regulator with GAF, ATPase, and Fis domain